ncbi:MAG: hypothetical protein WBV55_19050 [Candidatus Sulfotelmatobacter sp.]
MLAIQTDRSSGNSPETTLQSYGAVLLDGVRYLEGLATKSELDPLGDNPECRYDVPASELIILTHVGIPLG